MPRRSTNGKRERPSKKVSSTIALRRRELVYVRAKDVMEVVEVVERATRYRRGRVVLALVVPCEDLVERTVRDCAPVHSGLRRLGPMRVDRASVDDALTDAVAGVMLDRLEEKAAKLVLALREPR